MNEHHIVVQRTARYHSLGGPAENASEVWFVVHGYAQLARFFLRSFESVASARRLVIAPEALNRYYFETSPGVHAADARVAATWMTREERAHEIADYVAYLDALAERVRETAPTARVTALGFSQGGATVSRWAALGRARIDHVVLWGSAPAHDLELGPGTFRGARLTLAFGNADPHISAARTAREEQRLREAGQTFDVLRYDGGHTIPPAALLQLTP